MASIPEPESKGTSIIDPTNYQEQQETKSLRLEEAVAVVGFRRPIANLPWVLSCIGLYLGALLYGMHSSRVSE
jgi:hypothetical protein